MCCMGSTIFARARTIHRAVGTALAMQHERPRTSEPYVSVNNSALIFPPSRARAILMHSRRVGRWQWVGRRFQCTKDCATVLHSRL
jgi:hypothetical protein